MRLGIIGAGPMGREVASAAARWCALEEPPTNLVITAACDVDRSRLGWFERVGSIRLLSTDFRELIQCDEVDALYVALPHNLHEQVCSEIIASGKPMLAEKPFGISLEATERLVEACSGPGAGLVRISSEFPFMPGAQAAFDYCAAGRTGTLIEARAGFLHSSDLDPAKPISWKRQSASCGKPGVMSDLGLHVAHLPLRLGWRPKSVYARLQNLVPARPDGHGGAAECDTWDNAHVDCVFGEAVPLSLELKRIAPGEMNTWFFEAIGMEGGVRFSTKEPKTLWEFAGSPGQGWIRRDVGHAMSFPVITGAIFEAGFPDIILQMLASFAAEASVELGGRFGCATPHEALESQRIFAAALDSHERRQVAWL